MAALMFLGAFIGAIAHGARGALIGAFALPAAYILIVLIFAEKPSHAAVAVEYEDA